jgi:signal transduction histidine kinase
MLGPMASSFELLQTRERLRVGQRFIGLRPVIAALGALGNALLLGTSSAPPLQKLVLLAALGSTVVTFFAEAQYLARRELSERWLLGSLCLTLLALGAAALLSGGLTSPVLPLLFAPVVVGFAAFARARASTLLLVEAVAVLSVLAAAAPLPGFPELPATALRGMLLVSCLASLALLAVGVIGLVEAHGRIAAQLDRMRADMLKEAERRAASMEHLGAQVAHEVKNPLSAARGLVQLVQRHAHDAKDRERLDVVVGEVDRALGVLNDYLTFARPLSDLALARVELRGVLEDVCGVLEARAAEKAVQVRIAGPRLDAWVDRQRLRDALLNLALNALTALPRGGALTLATQQTEVGVELCVDDDGPGMSSQQLSRLGQPFASESAGGTGLGVLLAQSAARQHGGELSFESTPGRGTRARLRLPLEVQRHAKVQI